MEDLHSEISDQQKRGLLIGLMIFFALFFILPFLVTENSSVFSVPFLISLALYSGLVYCLKRRIFSKPSKPSIINMAFILAISIAGLLLCVFGAFAPFLYPDDYKDSNIGRGFGALIIAIPALVYVIKLQFTKLLIKSVYQTTGSDKHTVKYQNHTRNLNEVS